MISKQAKDFIDLVNEGFSSIPLGCRNPYKLLTISTPPGSDWDIDRILKTIKEQPMYVIQSKPSLEESMDVLCNELKDEDYYRNWKDNIAMAFKDLVQYNVKFDNGEPITVLNRESVHVLANNAADNFLKQLMK